MQAPDEQITVDYWNNAGLYKIKRCPRMEKREAGPNFVCQSIVQVEKSGK